MTRNTGMYSTADVHYAIHEGAYRVLAIWPSPTGRLTDLVDYWVDAFVNDSDLKPWVFMEVPMLQDAVGNRFPDHHIRGVRNGSLADGQAFLDACRQLGLVVEHCNWHVPFASGQHYYGHNIQDDFNTKDLRYLRSDEPPSMAQLEELSKP